MKKLRVLISGAGIAGPCLAHFLNKEKFAVTMVEKASGLRRSGQNVDIRGAGIEVIRRMGLLEQVRAANTTERGLLFVDEKNHAEAAFPSTGDDSFTAEYEILRSELAQLLFQSVRDDVAARFGVSVTSLQQTAQSVLVKFSDGTSEDYDLVVAADGVGSRIRSLMLGRDDFYDYIGLYCAYVTLPKSSNDSRWARWYNAPGGKAFLFRPDNHGTTRAAVTFLADVDPKRQLSHDDELAMLEKAIAGTGWESERMLRAMHKQEDLYCGPLSQVHAPRWSVGRCALLGDAAYCPTPVTGAGTTLALVGAYVLAGELNNADTHGAAFENYEKLLRPFVEQRQKLPPGTPRLAHPKSKAGIYALHQLARLAASRPVKTAKAFLSKHPIKRKRLDFALPEYKH